MLNLTKFFEDYILYEILILIWLLFFWKSYLSFRQKSLVTRLVDLPASIQGLMTKDVYDKARTYSLDRLNFSDFENVYSKLLTTILLLSNCYLYFWQSSIEIAKYLGINHENEIFLSAICMVIINVIYDTMDLPLKIYNTFVLEEKHGFNKETWMFFVKDQLLKFLVGQAIAVPLLCAVIWIVENGGDYFFFYFWLFSIAVTLFIMILYPEVIAPLFDKYTPLPEGDLKNQIEALALSVNFPLYKLYVVEGSKRSSHSNAYFYGLHKHKRIVLFDTLVKEYNEAAGGKADEKGCETDEVLAILAHELGHWKYSHTLKLFLLSQVSFCVNIFLYAKLLDYKPMYAAFGFAHVQPTFIGLIIITMYILIPFNTLMQFVSVVIGRRFEFEADKFGKIVGRGEDLKQALIKLQKDNLSYPLYDKWYSNWHHSHPPLLERLEAIGKGY